MDSHLSSLNPLLSDAGDGDAHSIEAITVEYHGLEQEAFDKKYGRIQESRFTIKDTCKKIKENCSCSGACMLSLLRRYVPVIDMFRTYRFKEYILGDIIAGISLAILQVPQSMGYALLATLPPIIGLYTSFFPVLVYFIFGRSRHVSIGTMALTGLILASSMSKAIPQFIADNNLEVAQNLTNQSNPSSTDLSNPIVQEKIKIAMSISFTAGLILTTLSFMKFGILATYISDPFLSGYICGCNIQVLTHQFKHILGITVGEYSGMFSFFYLVWDMCLNLKNTNIATLITSAIATVTLFVVKKFINQRYASKLRVPVPIDIIVVITATLISHFCKFEENFGVKIVKYIPQGLPEPVVPAPKYMTTYLLDAIILGLVNYVLIFIMVKMFSQKYNYPYDPDQEMLATGLAGVFGAFFSSMAGSTSPPRCILGDQAGGKTQLAQLFSASLILLTLLFLAPLLEPLPLCILASLVLVSCIPLFAYYKACILYWRTSKHDLAVWAVSMMATFLVGVDIGILIGMSFSVLIVVIRTQTPYSTSLGYSHQDNTLLDIKRYSPNAKMPDPIRIFRFEAPIYFATIDLFQERLFSATVSPSASQPSTTELKVSSPVHDEPVADEQNKHDDSMEIINGALPCSLIRSDPTQIEAIILDCTSIAFIDTSGAIALGKLQKEYKAINILFVLAQMCETAKHTVNNVEQCKNLVIYPSLYDAIVAVIRLQDSTRINNQDNLTEDLTNL